MQKARGRGVLSRLGVGRAGALVALLAAAALCGVALAAPSCDGGVQIERSSAAAAGSDGGDSETEGPESGAVATTRTLVVHVDGAVASPGVYELSGDVLRVNDAVVAAGGLLPEADTTSMNLAAELVDGQKVLVPAAATEGQASEAGTAGPASASAAASGLVNINLATAEQLQALSGVGEATARAIVEDREAHGPFSSPEDLMRVSGIGQKKFEKLRGQICV